MGLKTSCDSCGRGVSGVTSSLKKVNGRYLCPDCVKNPTGALRYKCNACGALSAGGRRKGNLLIEILLWLCWLVPGIIYSIWRRSGPATVCTNCGMSALVAIPPGATPPAPRNEVPCPACAEPILAEAKKCKHCGTGVAA